MALTKKQYEILNYIYEFQQDNGYSPTLAEIGEALSITRMTAHEHVGKLERKGVISRVRDEARSIEILRADLLTTDRAEELPLAGLITAGAGVEAVERHETFSVRELLPPGKECYVLKVKGDSMIEDGIHDGDYVIVERTETALNGQTVVAIIDDNQATLKRLYREKKGFRLQPANASMQPIYRDQVDIRGIVVGIYRKL